jgi:hypothetical protein
MVDMEMMKNVVDKQGWFGSIQMDQESELTASHMHFFSTTTAII